MLLATPTSEAEKAERQVHVNGHDYTLREYVGTCPCTVATLMAMSKTTMAYRKDFWSISRRAQSRRLIFTKPISSRSSSTVLVLWAKHPAGPLTVQYANGHTPYGPIEAGENGVRYFTLRQMWDPGAKYMPQSRDKLRKGNQRTRIRANIPTYSSAERLGRKQSFAETIFEREADGLAASIRYLAPEAVETLPPPQGTGGQYLIVTSGEMLFEEAVFDRWSTVFVTTDEDAFEVHAGSEGLDLVLQFPQH